MVLGYCMTCAKLVPIRKGGQKWGSRQAAWFPQEHENPTTGARCDGTKREIR